MKWTMIDSTLKNANILIVDDQQANIDLITGLLDAKGYTSYTYTTDPRQVIRLFGEFKPDLILLDLQMPHLTGFQVLMHLNELISPEEYIPILVLTADITIESKRKSLAGGAKDFLTKPFDLVETDLRIRNLLFTRYLMTQVINQNFVLETKVKERTTELEKSNLNLLLAKDKAEEMNRLKTNFLASMSHELRTPLIGILGYAEFLGSELKDKELIEMVNIIITSGKRLNTTLNNILDISKIEAEKKELNFKDLDLLKFLREQINLFKAAAEEKNLSLNFETFEEKLNAYIDEEMFMSIISNLINNAIKYTEKGEITLIVRKETDTAVIEVKDTGIGVPEDYQEIIFEPFRQSSEGFSRKFEGTGLGLTLVKKYTELMGGTITLKSKPGEGSTFTLKLPINKNIDENLIKTNWV